MMGMDSTTLVSSWMQHTALLAAVLLVNGCGPTSQDSANTRESGASSIPAETHGQAGESAAHGHAATADNGMTLLAIMQRLGGNMTALTHGLMTQDTAAVRVQANAIAEHAPIVTSDLERIKRELGTRIGTFDAVDESVHVAAVALRDAAQSGQLDVVLNRLHEVQRGCVSCHAQFREQLRTNPTSR